MMIGGDEHRLDRNGPPLGPRHIGGHRAEQHGGVDRADDGKEGGERGQGGFEHGAGRWLAGAGALLASFAVKHDAGEEPRALLKTQASD